MASKKMFASASTSSKAPATNTVNAAGGSAYKMSVKHALAQYAVTGTFADGFYTTGADQLENFTKLLGQTDPIFAAKLAVYARQKGLMKDTPAAILAWIASQDVEVLKRVFGKVVNNSKMLRNFVQMIRSGKFGRKSFGNAAKKAIQKWIDARSDEKLFDDAVGNDPSLADIIKMVHVKPSNKTRQALYGYILGKDKVIAKDLPKIVKAFEAFKKGETSEIPAVSWQRLTALPLTDKNWKDLAATASWTTTRMNLNTFARHGVFKDAKMVKAIAAKLADRDEIQKAKVFPYQLLMAYLFVEGDVPSEIKNALQEAMEVAVENVPSLNGLSVKIAVDTSGSMSSNLTGNRGTATSKAACIDVASLIASTLLRKNKGSKLYPFDTSVHSASSVNAFDSIMTNASKLRKFGGGGTDCGCAMRAILEDVRKGDTVDVVVFVSDNESWYRDNGTGRPTGVAETWAQIRKINPKAKMICVDLIGNDSTQIVDGKGVLNVGGWSDEIFNEINRFVSEFNANTWVEEIEKIEI